MSEPKLFHGEDFISAARANDIHALASTFRASGIWEEVVPGLADLTVKYDPLSLTIDQAGAHFRRLWNAGSEDNVVVAPPATLTARVDEALDLASVTDTLGLAKNEWPNWFAARKYRVAIMGFQPGLAYLEDLDGKSVPALPRLDTPRQNVPAGSIGFLGKRVCVYPFDGPGGWPIVGRVSEPLFRRDHSEPFLLQPGQMVRFAIG